MTTDTFVDEIVAPVVYLAIVVAISSVFIAAVVRLGRIADALERAYPPKVVEKP